MKKCALISTLLLIVMFSCKKETQIQAEIEQEYDTIKPRSYFPVYPKSWWKYKIDGATITLSNVSDGYQMHSYRISEDYDWLPLESSDTIWVTFLDSKPIYGYEKIEYIRPPFGGYYVRWPILSETVGFMFKREWSDQRYGDYSEHVEVKNKIFNGIDSLLILEGHWVYGQNVTHRSYQEFTKGVGLTKEFILDTVSMDTIFKKELIDYYINN